LKTSPSGVTTTFFSNDAVNLIAKDSSDNIYVMTDSAGDFRFGDSSSIAIQKLTPSGVSSVVCNSADCTSIGAMQGIAGAGGVVDSNGNIYFPIVFWASGNTYAWSEIAQVTPSGSYSIYAGTTPSSGSGECVDGGAGSATFSGPVAMTIDSSNNIYMNDQGIDQVVCNSLREISAGGVVSTVHSFGATTAYSLAMDSLGSFYYDVYTGSSTGSKIMKLTSGVETTYCGGGPSSAGPTGSCSNVYIQQIDSDLVFDSSGDLYFGQSASGASTTNYMITPN
jgi:hypothetical protein